MNQKEVNKILAKHADWLRGNGGQRADLWGADLWGANLRGADLREANLRGADLREANLWEANLQGADLCEADLWRADLREANLREANLQGVSLQNTYGIKFFQWGRHTAIFDNHSSIIIGCENHTIKHWLENIDAIGKENNYTKEEIEAYGVFIKMCSKEERNTRGKRERG